VNELTLFLAVKMYFKSNNLSAVILLAAALSTSACNASAALFSSVTYNQAIEAAPLGQPSVDKFISGDTLPFLQTLSLNNGASVQAIYNFSDNGILASLKITGTYNLTGTGQAAGEGTNSSVVGKFTFFEFNEPVNYQIAFQAASSPNVNTGAGFELDDDTGHFVLGSGNIINNSWQATGTFPADVGYYVTEDYLIRNDVAGDAPTASGSHNLTMTFTAVPEPSSLCLLCGIAGIATRRRRLRKD
jgi:hypothetical protein